MNEGTKITPVGGHLLHVGIDSRNKSMETNPVLREAIFEVVENQLDANDPPETGIALARLIEEGYSEEDARVYIAQAVSVEIWDALHNKKEFNLERYIRNLENLPEEPER